MTAWRLAVLVLRMSVAVTLVVSGSAKMGDRASFAAVLGAAFRIPQRWRLPLGVGVALSEATIGLASLLGVWERMVDAAVLVITLGLLASAAVAWPQGGTPCACFGSLGRSTFGAAAVARSGSLATCSLIVVLAPASYPWSQIALGWRAAVFTLGMGVAATAAQASMSLASVRARSGSNA